MKLFLGLSFLVASLVWGYSVELVETETDTYLQVCESQTGCTKGVRVRVEDFNRVDCVYRTFDGKFSKTDYTGYWKMPNGTFSCHYEEWANGCRVVMRLSGKFVTWRQVPCKDIAGLPIQMGEALLELGE
jgi:hypothetical protein